MATGAHAGKNWGSPAKKPRASSIGFGFLRNLALKKAVKAEGHVVVLGGWQRGYRRGTLSAAAWSEGVSILYRARRTTCLPMRRRSSKRRGRREDNTRFVAPKQPGGGKGKVKGIECTRMSLGTFDASGRRRPEVIPGSDFVVEADMVVAAIGQAPDLSYLTETGCAPRRKGTIEVVLGTLAPARKAFCRRRPLFGDQHPW